jgi:hypothetical protein
MDVLPYIEIGLLRKAVDEGGVYGARDEEADDNSEVEDEPVDSGKTLSTVLDRWVRRGDG